MNYEDLFDLDEIPEDEYHFLFTHMFEDVSELENEEDSLWGEENE